MQSGNLDFRNKVFYLVSQIPMGRVMTYGQIAALCGSPGASRVVGGIAHFGSPDLPWQRVVNKRGGLAAGYYGGREGHKKDLQAEGVEVFGEIGAYYINVNDLIWWPSKSNNSELDK